MFNNQNNPPPNGMQQRYSTYVQPNHIQPAPIGSMLNNSNAYGYGGGGYYNGYYGGGYYNPYELQKRQEQQVDLQKKETERQFAILRSLAEASIRDFTPNISQEERDAIINRFVPEKIEEKINEFELENRMERLLSGARPSSVDPEKERLRLRRAQICQYNRDNMPEDADLLYFLNNSKYLSRDLEREEFIKNCRNAQNGMRETYNTDQFNQLVDMHSSSSNYFYNSLSRGPNIDDMEIPLPSRLGNNSEAAKRREAFLAAILKE